MTTSRWSLLVARTWQAGKTDVAADILATVAPRAIQGTVEASKDASHPTEEGIVLEDLHKMLDETGMQDLLHVSEERCKELERLKPSISTDAHPKYGP